MWVGVSRVSAMTHTPASGPLVPITTPPMSSLSTATAAGATWACMPASEVRTIAANTTTAICVNHVLVIWTSFETIDTNGGYATVIFADRLVNFSRESGQYLPSLYQAFGEHQRNGPAKPACRGHLIQCRADADNLKGLRQHPEGHETEREHVTSRHPLPMLFDQMKTDGD